MQLVSRRAVLSLATTAFSYNKILGANNRVRVGFIGLGSMGRDGNMPNFLKQKNVEVSGVCDVYGPHLERTRKKTEPHSSELIVTSDFREILDDKDTDAVCISTPDHWHALMTIEAFKAGKHVYCEKPIAHTVSEVELVHRAGEKYRRIFQSGQQQRSANQFREAVHYVQNNNLGELKSIHTWYWGQTKSIGNPPDSNPPPDLDWNMWCGPAPFVPFNPNRFLFNWRWFWDYANGWFGDWGPHMVDIAIWGLPPFLLKGPSLIENKDKFDRDPSSCPIDNRETPLSFRTIYHFQNLKIEFEYNGCADKSNRHWGIEWLGENGSVYVNRRACEIRNLKGQLIRTVKANGKSHRQHWHNFIESIRNNNLDTNASLPNIAETNVLCLAAAAAHKLSRAEPDTFLHWDPWAWWTKIPYDGKYLIHSYRPPWKLEI